MLAVLFSGICTTILVTTQTRDTNTENEQGKTTNLHFPFILGATLHKESQRAYWKRMKNIWEECVRFQTTSQRLTDQVRTIIKKSWFSDLEILEIHQKVNWEPRQ